MIGIIFAMKEELSELLNIISIKSKKIIFDLTFYEGNINNNKCILVECGIGKVNAARCTQMLIDNYNVDYIFNIGVAGSVSDKVNICDIVIADKLVQHDFDITVFNHKKGYIPNVGDYIECDKKLVEKAMKLKDENIHVGVIASGDIFCSEKKMGEKINSKFNALCVEMEGASVAHVCYLCKIPFLIVRSISDSPNNDNNKLTYEEFLKISSKKIANYIKELIINI